MTSIKVCERKRRSRKMEDGAGDGAAAGRGELVVCYRERIKNVTQIKAGAYCAGID